MTGGLLAHRNLLVCIDSNNRLCFSAESERLSSSMLPLKCIYEECHFVVQAGFCTQMQGGIILVSLC